MERLPAEGTELRKSNELIRSCFYSFCLLPSLFFGSMR